MKRILLALSICLLSAIATSAQSIATANAYLEGRATEGSLPRPSYNAQGNSTVVVSIWVDHYGKVVKALADDSHTTTNDKSLLAAARNAAMNARFKQKMDGPPLQEGTITYTFESDPDEVTSLKTIVENRDSGRFLVSVAYNETYNLNGLVILVEEDDYIIPVQLQKKDLGAIKRFQSLFLQKGDSLKIRGTLNTITVEREEYKGLKDAVILNTYHK